MSKLLGAMGMGLGVILWGCGSVSNFETNSPFQTTANPTAAIPLQPVIQRRYVTQEGGFNDYRPTFSPDGKTLVFERNAVGVKGGVRLHQVAQSGGPVTALLGDDFKEQSTRPDWSIASNRIAFTAEGPNGDTLWIVNPDGSNRFKVAPEIFSPVVDYPHWFPDGQSLAVTDYGTPPLENFRGVVRKVTLPIPVTLSQLTRKTEILAGDSSVSRDGRWLTLAAQADVTGKYNQDTNNIFVIDLNNPGSAPILFDRGQGRAPAWSPDGKAIIFESSRGNQNNLYAIYLKPFTGHPSDADQVAVALTPDSLDCQHAEFSPDGSQIVLSALQDDNGKPNQPRGIMILQVPQ